MREPPKTHFGQLLAAAGLSQERLAQRAGTSKQQINRYVKGERVPTARMAQLIAPFLGVEWHSLLEPNVGEKSSAGVDARIIIPNPNPQPGDEIYDLDEAALLRMWRKLSIVRRAALFAHLGADDMPSLRKPP